MKEHVTEFCSREMLQGLHLTETTQPNFPKKKKKKTNGQGVSEHGFLQDATLIHCYMEPRFGNTFGAFI